MLTDKPEGQSELEVVYIEQLVPEDHLLRKVQRAINFRFIIDKVRHLYSPDNGRPSLDPVVLFKMLLIGYLFGIRSERRLVQEIKVNIAYRWFLGLKLSDPVPSPSTIWENRRTKWKGTDVFQEIFDEIVRQAIHHGLVDGKVLYSDSTHIKAKANKRKFLLQHVPVSTREYLKDLDEAVAADRVNRGKKRLPARKEVKPQTREIKVSTTDPEAGYMVREGKPEGFFYLDHRTVDGAHNFITDIHVTPATVHDSVPYLSRLDRQCEVFGFEVAAVALDAGYLTTPICHGLEQRGIFGVIGGRRFKSKQDLMPKWKFKYDAAEDLYHCPGNSMLTYRTTNREGYREYKSDPQTCSACLLRPICTRSKAMQKTLTRHVWEDSRERMRDHRLSPSGKALYAGRKEKIERSFADAKELHGQRYARMRGRAKVQEQCLMAATAQNIKKLALILDRRGRRALSA